MYYPLNEFKLVKLTQAMAIYVGVVALVGVGINLETIIFRWHAVVLNLFIFIFYGRHSIGSA